MHKHDKDMELAYEISIRLHEQFLEELRKISPEHLDCSAHTIMCGFVTRVLEGFDDPLGATGLLMGNLMLASQNGYFTADETKH